jgi:hypothetical protein
VERLASAGEVVPFPTAQEGDDSVVQADVLKTLHDGLAKQTISTDMREKLTRCLRIMR